MRDNVGIVRDHYAASARGDLAGMVADFDLAMEWQSMAPVPKRVVGAETVVEEIFGTFAGLYERFGVEVEHLYDAGDSVFALVHYVGRSNGGQDFRIRACHHWGLDDGRIVRFEQFADSAPIVRAQTG